MPTADRQHCTRLVSSTSEVPDNTTYVQAVSAIATCAFGLDVNSCYANNAQLPTFRPNLNNNCMHY
jgi:hypothetical protein